MNFELEKHVRGEETQPTEDTWNMENMWNDIKRPQSPHWLLKEFPNFFNETSKTDFPFSAILPFFHVIPMYHSILGDDRTSLSILPISLSLLHPSAPRTCFASASRCLQPERWIWSWYLVTGRSGRYSSRTFDITTVWYCKSLMCNHQNQPSAEHSDGGCLWAMQVWTSNLRVESTKSTYRVPKDGLGHSDFSSRSLWEIDNAWRLTHKSEHKWMSCLDIMYICI